MDGLSYTLPEGSFSGVEEGEAVMLSGAEPVLDLKVDPLEKNK